MSSAFAAGMLTERVVEMSPSVLRIPNCLEWGSGSTASLGCASTHVRPRITWKIGPLLDLCIGAASKKFAVEPKRLLFGGQKKSGMTRLSDVGFSTRLIDGPSLAVACSLPLHPHTPSANILAMSQSAIVTTQLPLTLIAKGKVRDVYDAGITDGPHAGAILFVATDRISAFDIILQNGIPNKGKLLHALSTFWFGLLTPSLIESHIIATDYQNFPAELKQRLDAVKDQVEGRSMLVKRAKVLPIEAIVRGYITGSGWAEYKRSGTVHGIKLQEGLQESQQIPNGPLFTPSTKADQGDHDENIHPDKGELSPIPTPNAPPIDTSLLFCRS